MGEWRYSCIILDLCTRWRRVVSFTPLAALPPVKEPRYQFIGDWVGPRTGLEAVEWRNIPAPAGSRTPSIQSLARRCTDWALPAPLKYNQEGALFYDPLHRDGENRAGLRRRIVVSCWKSVYIALFFTLWSLNGSHVDLLQSNVDMTMNYKR
jgi:hypothetical protein